jgi:EmrB/QacA subfamily drug resistance transporter
MRGNAPPRLALAVLCTAQFLVVLDMTVVTVALPELQAGLGLPGASAHWVMTAYAVAFGGSLLVGGRAADAYGRRRMLRVGAGLFAAASLACAVAPTAAVLLLARAGQGVGGALLSTAAFGILVATFEAGPVRTRAIATWGSVGSLGAISGFVVGGALTQFLGWRAVFLATAPVGALLLAVAPRVVPGSRVERATAVGGRGAVLATAGVASLTLAVSSASAAGPTSVRALGAVGFGVVALAAFVLHERRSTRPLVPSGLLRGRSFAAAGVVGVAYGSTMLAVLMLLAVYLQSARGLSALEAGALMLLLRVPAIGWARVAGRLVGRFGPGPFLLLGSAAMALGVLLLARVATEGPLAPQIVPGLLVLGAAIPSVAVAVSAAALGDVRPTDAGVGAGLLTTFQWVGGSLGFAVVSAIAGDPHAAAGGSVDAVVASVHAGLLATTGLALAALLVAAVALTSPRVSLPVRRAGWPARPRRRPAVRAAVDGGVRSVPVCAGQPSA